MKDVSSYENIEQIEARVAEIKVEMNEENANIEELSNEFDALETRRAELSEIKAELEKKAKLQAVADGEGQEVPTNIPKEAKHMADMNEVRSSKAYLDAYANGMKRGYKSGEFDFSECRALLTDLGGGQIPTPVYVEDRVSTAWERDGVTSKVKKSYMKGTIRLGVEIGADDASIHTEGAAAPDAENLVIAVVSIAPETVKKWIQISDEVLDSTSEAFLDYVYDELTYRVAKKTANRLIAKIMACGTVSTTSPSTNIAVAAIATSAVSVGLVASALAELCDDADNPSVILNKKTWGAMKQAQYAANFPVDPFEGCDKIYNNSITAFSAATTGVCFMIVGDLAVGAQMNFPNGDTVAIKYDDKDDAEADLVKIVARLPVGSAVIKENAFCQIKKAANPGA